MTINADQTVHPRGTVSSSKATETAPNATAAAYPRHVIALAKRSLIKMWRTPEALIDVTLQPIIFLLMFTYIFGGAIAGSSADYLQYLLPGLLGQTIAGSFVVEQVTTPAGFFAQALLP